jgi:hypothetical protein
MARPCAISVILRQGGFALGIALLAGVLRALDSSTLSIAPTADPYTVIFFVAGVSALVSALAVFVLTAPRANAQA